jgi:hypothetical protein
MLRAPVSAAITPSADVQRANPGAVSARQNVSARNNAQNQYFRYKRQDFRKWQGRGGLPGLPGRVGGRDSGFRVQGSGDLGFRISDLFGYWNLVIGHSAGSWLPAPGSWLPAPGLPNCGIFHGKTVAKLASRCQNQGRGHCCQWCRAAHRPRSATGWFQVRLASDSLACIKEAVGKVWLRSRRLAA